MKNVTLQNVHAPGFVNSGTFKLNYLRNKVSNNKHRKLAKSIMRK
ncbi:hypothetical protein TRIP_D120058 [uncultured Paludibacter sp.]|uniref:Uncharacterized protein n=1 Tax=uncultured Paludibacter sp. TaxID=497635 RepID=A0A653A5S6_9BACT|nr:hypothetical protein TRIP_D120058 [uncultured Paludibacter sp.]